MAIVHLSIPSIHVGNNNAKRRSGSKLVGTVIGGWWKGSPVGVFLLVAFLLLYRSAGFPVALESGLNALLVEL